MNLLSFAEPEASEALEAFLGECLFSAGVWSSPRGGDDIARLRVMESSPGRVRLLGAIWLIATQTQAPFWLDLAEEVPGSARVRWALHFDLVTFGQGRRSDMRHAVDLMAAPEQGTWRVVIQGVATV